MDRGAEPTLCVIIPVLNEAASIDGVLASLAGIAADEILVVDGKSDDDTLAKARATPGIGVIEAARGRGSQIAAGVDHASADIVLILHADTRLPAGARGHIMRAMADQRIVGGSFRLRFDDDRWPFRLYAWATRYETMFTTFGDQAMFARREAIAAAGGVPPWPLLEDVELRRRLRRIGGFAKLQATVITSARRFRRVGVVSGQLLNAAVLMGYLAGVSPERLARYYGATRK